MEVGTIRQLFDDARTARTIFGCSDATCCGDVEKMLGNPASHAMVQGSRLADALSAMPESVRTDQFLEAHVEPRMKEAKRATKLKKMDEGLRKTVSEAAKRLERVNDALHGLHKREGQPDFAPEAGFRVRQGTLFPMNRTGRPS